MYNNQQQRIQTKLKTHIRDPRFVYRSISTGKLKNTGYPDQCFGETASESVSEGFAQAFASANAVIETLERALGSQQI